MTGPLAAAGLVALGGALGALTRYGANLAVGAGLGGRLWVATLAVNLVGCLAIGALVGLAESRGPLTRELQALLVVGFLGSLTTFSTFALETDTFLRAREVLLAAGYVALQVGLGLPAVWLGRHLAA